MPEDPRAVRDAFHQLLYGHFLGIEWQGVLTLKNPMDLMVYQEILFERRPELIIETGSYRGGSALFLAQICDLLDCGQVVSIDIEPAAERGETKVALTSAPAPTDGPGIHRPEHPRITWLTGDSVSEASLRDVRSLRENARSAMVILDSNHKRGHVLRELKAYAPMVSLGDYLIVEDTNVNGHPVFPEHGPGPWEAVETFLSQRDDFRIDVAREKFLLSFNPAGYLKRVA